MQNRLLYCSQYVFCTRNTTATYNPNKCVTSFDYHKCIIIIINTHLKCYYECLLMCDSLIKAVKRSLTVFMQKQFTHTLVFLLSLLLDENLISPGLVLLMLSD